MSKLFSGKKYFLKPIRPSGDSYVNQSMQNILDIYSKNQSGISKDFSSFNKNNITVDYPKHYSPANRSQVSLPPISGKNRYSNNSQKKPIQKKLLNSNSSTNLYSQSLFGPGSKKLLEREKTQFNLIENNLGKNKNNLNTIDASNNNNNMNNNNLNNITQINNITNINIHIYQDNLNKSEENLNKDEILQKSEPILNEPGNVFQNNNINSNDKIQNQLFKIKQNKINNSPISTFESAGMSIINPKINNSKKNNSLNNKKQKVVKGNIKILPANSSSLYGNKSISNSLSSIGSLIMNNNSINNKNKNSQRGFSHNKGNNINIKNVSASLPDINTGRSISINKKISNLDNDLINLLKEENNILNAKDLENIDISMNFLKDLSTYNSTFVSFLELIQTHMDIQILLDNTETTGNNLFRRKAINMINNDKIFKLNKLLNNYFEILSTIYLKNNNAIIPNNINNPAIINNNNTSNNKTPIDNFFLYQSINIIFHKSIKLQICLFCAMLISLSQLNIYEINTMIKNHFLQIIKEILNPLLNIFDTFIKEEINLNYPELITINLRPDFNEHYNKLHKVQKYTHNYKNSELISLISKNLDKCVNSMKYYSTLNLKYSTIKPFGDALNQLLYTIDKKSLNQFSVISLKTILFGELQENKNRALRNCTASTTAPKNLNGLIVGSSIINNIKDFPPFLPPINPKYKYTLVLDMDETLIHYFFTNVSGMFFVRPYCFDFLKELNDLYEIVTFTAGTKDYADNILNILDMDNNIIKYRLYRQHTTILGFSVYKDLTKLGRDLSKVIIIDNLKENFKMQPNNGIFIKTWTNDINDVQFKDLLKILKDIVLFNVNDVRLVIQKMNEEIKISRNIVRPYGNINVSKLIG